MVWVSTAPLHFEAKRPAGKTTAQDPIIRDCPRHMCGSRYHRSLATAVGFWLDPRDACAPWAAPHQRSAVQYSRTDAPQAERTLCALLRFAGIMPGGARSPEPHCHSGDSSCGKDPAGNRLAHSVNL